MADHYLKQQQSDAMLSHIPRPAPQTPVSKMTYMHTCTYVGHLLAHPPHFTLSIVYCTSVCVQTEGLLYCHPMKVGGCLHSIFNSGLSLSQ